MVVSLIKLRTPIVEKDRVMVDEVYLAHYGVKGMKWGVRRYDDDLRVRRAKKQYADAKKSKSLLETKYASQELKDTKTRVRMENRRLGISNREKKLVDKYQKNGLTKSEAELEAYKRVQTERALAVLGGITVAGAAAYLVKRGYVRNVDAIIKSGTKIQNLNIDGMKTVRDGFYGVTSKSDMAKYKGEFARTIRRGGILGNENNPVTRTILEATSDIKVASSKSAQKVMADMVRKNPKYKEDLMTDIGAHFAPTTLAQKRLKANAWKAISKGEVNKSVYEVQNILVGDRTSRTGKTFVQGLKNAGYGGVRDVNDLFYSGYNAKTSTIFTDAAKTSVKSASTMSTKEINVRFGIGVGKSFVSNYGVGTLAGISGGSLITSTSNRKAVERYRKEHPNTNMSYNEILRYIEDANKKKK